MRRDLIKKALANEYIKFETDYKRVIFENNNNQVPQMLSARRIRNLSLLSALYPIFMFFDQKNSVISLMLLVIIITSVISAIYFGREYIRLNNFWFNENKALLKSELKKQFYNSHATPLLLNECFQILGADDYKQFLFAAGYDESKVKIESIVKMIEE